MSRPTSAADSDQKRRVIFTIDVEALSAIEQIQVDGGYADLTETIKDSLMILRAIQTQSKQGFTDLVTRNPDTGDELHVVPHSATPH